MALRGEDLESIGAAHGHIHGMHSQQMNGGEEPVPREIRDQYVAAYVKEAVITCKQLYTVVIPETAAKLDMMQVVPLDSYGFTTFLHSQVVGTSSVLTQY